MPESAHMAASLRSRELAGWDPVSGSADADWLFDLGVARARSRDLSRNHGIASGAHQTLADNIVGTGLRVVPTPDYRALGKDKVWADEWSKNTVSRWRAYAETTECDASGQSNFYGLTSQVLRGGLLNGESLALPLWIDGRGRYRTKFQIVESDRLSTPFGQLDGPHMRGGIEIDDYGRPLAYWLRKSHPGDIYLSFVLNVMDWERIPAETGWGRKRVIHVHDKERTGQSRGKPILTPVLTQFKMLDHYQRTEIQAAVVNAMIAAFIETPLDSQGLIELFGGDVTSQKYQAYLNLRNEYRTPLKGGAVVPLAPGEKLSSFTPGRPATAYSMFVESLMRHIGAGIGLPYELLLKDFSKTNYSSARAAILEAWRFFLGRRSWLATLWCTPAYELWLEEAINAGEIEAPGFYDNRFAYTRCRWMGPGRGWVDPMKEAQAMQIRMQTVSTLEIECAEQGLDWEEVLEQQAVEMAKRKELGLPDPWIATSRQPLQLAQAENEEEADKVTDPVPAQEKQAA